MIRAAGPAHPTQIMSYAHSDSPRQLSAETTSFDWRRGMTIRISDRGCWLAAGNVCNVARARTRQAGRRGEEARCVHPVARGGYQRSMEEARSKAGSCDRRVLGNRRSFARYYTALLTPSALRNSQTSSPAWQC